MTPRPTRAGDATPPSGNWTGGTPSSTPGRGGATPSRTPTNPSQPAKETPNTNLSLTDFQARYTSEDNESFNTVLDRQNAKKRAKYGWLWNGNKIPSARQIAQAAHSQKLLTQGQNHDRNGSEERAKAIVLGPSANPDARPASIAQQRPYDPRNSLMFAPDDLSETHPHLPSTAQSSAETSRAGPKSVSYTSTRLPTSAFPGGEDEQNGSSVPESPSLSAIDAAIAGNPRHRAVSTAAPSDVDGGAQGGETPRVNGYAFVDAEPTASELNPAPPPPPTSRTDADADTNARGKGKSKIRDRNALLQHLLGINSNPNNSNGDEGSGSGMSGAPNPFTLHPASKREDLHHRMVERTSASKRVDPGFGSGSGPGSGRSDRLATLRSEGGREKTQTPRFMSSPVVGGRTPVGRTPVGRTPVAGSSTGMKKEKLDRGDLTPAGRNLFASVGGTPRTAASSNFSANGFEARRGEGGWTPKSLVGVRGKAVGRGV